MEKHYKMSSSFFVTFFVGFLCLFQIACGHGGETKDPNRSPWGGTQKPEEVPGGGWGTEGKGMGKEGPVAVNDAPSSAGMETGDSQVSVAAEEVSRKEVAEDEGASAVSPSTSSSTLGTMPNTPPSLSTRQPATGETQQTRPEEGEKEECVAVDAEQRVPADSAQPTVSQEVDVLYKRVVRFVNPHDAVVNSPEDDTNMSDQGADSERSAVTQEDTANAENYRVAVAAEEVSRQKVEVAEDEGASAVGPSTSASTLGTMPNTPPSLSTRQPTTVDVLYKRVVQFVNPHDAVVNSPENGTNVGDQGADSERSAVTQEDKANAEDYRVAVAAEEVSRQEVEVAEDEGASAVGPSTSASTLGTMPNTPPSLSTRQPATGETQQTRPEEGEKEECVAVDAAQRVPADNAQPTVSQELDVLYKRVVQFVNPHDAVVNSPENGTNVSDQGANSGMFTITLKDETQRDNHENNFVIVTIRPRCQGMNPADLYVTASPEGNRGKAMGSSGKNGKKFSYKKELKECSVKEIFLGEVGCLGANDETFKRGEAISFRMKVIPNRNKKGNDEYMLTVRVEYKGSNPYTVTSQQLLTFPKRPKYSYT